MKVLGKYNRTVQVKQEENMDIDGMRELSEINKKNKKPEKDIKDIKNKREEKHLEVGPKQTKLLTFKLRIRSQKMIRNNFLKGQGEKEEKRN